MSRCDSFAIVPNTSDDLPEPLTPVKTVSRRFGISTDDVLEVVLARADDADDLVRIGDVRRGVLCHAHSLPGDADTALPESCSMPASAPGSTRFVSLVPRSLNDRGGVSGVTRCASARTSPRVVTPERARGWFGGHEWWLRRGRCRVLRHPRARGGDGRVDAAAQAAAESTGSTAKLSRKTLAGSYAALIARSRASVAGGKASAMRSGRCDESKLRYEPSTCAATVAPLGVEAVRVRAERDHREVRRPVGVRRRIFGDVGHRPADRAELEEGHGAGFQHPCRRRGERRRDVLDETRRGSAARRRRAAGRGRRSP